MSNKKNDSLGDRMKQYEAVSKNFLTRRIPAIIRIDGKAFHTFTKGMRKPFDNSLMLVMQDTMRRLCEVIQGCVFGYTQSDEITLVLTDYATIKTDAWFGYNVQKMTSVAASMATLFFNDSFRHEYYTMQDMYGEDEDPERQKELSVFQRNLDKALFDARAFSVPKDEVCNSLIWRQQDATRNSIEAVGQANFSHRELQGKSCNMIQEMLWSQKGINWDDFRVDQKRGACCYQVETDVVMCDPRVSGESVLVKRKKWEVDCNPPIFSQDRAYIEQWI